MSRFLNPYLHAVRSYSSARSEFDASNYLRLDANEHPVESPYNRYPDPMCTQLVESIAIKENLSRDQVLVSNGSDQLIDMIVRAYCMPDVDRILSFTPGFSMFDYVAQVNRIAIDTLALDDQFDLPLADTLGYIDKSDPKIIFAVSPNNPTGNDLSPDRLLALVKAAPGLVVIDEAYFEFSGRRSYVKLLEENDHVIVLRTFSKAYGMAGLRLGYALARPELIEDLKKVRMPYDVDSWSQSVALSSLAADELNTSKIIQARNELRDRLQNLPQVKRVYPSDANFLLVIFSDAIATYRGLLDQGIVVRRRDKQVPNALRITVGTTAQNEQLIQALKRLA